IKRPPRAAKTAARETASAMRQRLPRLTAPARPALALAVAVGLAGTLATVAQLALLSQIIARAVQERPPLDVVRVSLLWFLGASIARAAALALQEVSGQRAAVRAKAALRARLLAHLVRLGPAYTRAERTGDLAAVA